MSTVKNSIVSRKYKFLNDEVIQMNIHHEIERLFEDNQNRTLVLDNSVRSGDVPVVGDHIQVVYEAGDQSAQEKSWRTGLLFAATLFMLFIMGYILVMIIAYALNRNMEPYKAFANVLIFRITLPLGTMAMFGMLSYSAFAYFFLGNPHDLPVI